MKDTRPEGAILLGHYPPGVVLHAPHCIDGENAMSVPVGATIEAHPNHQFDQCFIDFFSIVNDPAALAAVMRTSRSRSSPSGATRTPPSDPRDMTKPQPADAIRPLCRICRGTHEQDA
ncbi:hypothetical protein [Mangrovihabitans endophyticus]|uniref:Uncharacterized protein n=1 Tax=Mangrovihabitans endophyticus TaxID=1751298 RepID=A0A8J3FPJ6_9ACTN|nr:hypothetical protein [Mangrovihabitans endophyticus]GGL01780.1 hypothetical protein GCM10012284_40460 [Mangrovihabitans endophyticus]